MISIRLGRPGIKLFDAKKILFLLWLFLLVFPKGGFKIGEIPLTWGYLLLTLTSLFSLFFKSHHCHQSRINVLLSLIPFQVITSVSILVNGIEITSFAISFFISLFFLPFTFLYTLSNQIENLDTEYLYKLITKGILFISLFGTFLFFYKIISGKFFEIPFITVNYHDFKEMEGKCINRGNVFKLISTYNNGNIYGISILMFLPLYCLLERSYWKKGIVKLSLILTLSRTVWIGLLANEILSAIFIKNKNKFSIFNIIFGIAFTSFIILFVAQYFGFLSNFFFDRTLGGRGVIFDTLQLNLFTTKPFWGIVEMTYIGILDQFGVMGLLTFLIAIFAPLIFLAHSITIKPNRDKHRLSLLCGLFIYLFISASDGALLYIPIMAFYWFCVSLAMRKNLNQKDFECKF